jgi:hypothetical protein
MVKDARADIPLKTQLSDLFLVVNLLRLLFPFVTNAFCTIGRYYLKSNPYFKEFYKAVAVHLLFHYDYLRHLSSSLLRNFKDCELRDLDCFLRTLP